MMSLLFNMLSSLVIAFLSRNKRLLISWLQSLSTVILEPKKIKSITASTFSLLFAMKWWEWMQQSSFSECWVLSQLFHSPRSPSWRGSLDPLHFLQLEYLSIEMSIWTFSHFLNLSHLFFHYEWLEFFLYSGCYILIRYMICRRFLPFCGLYFMMLCSICL